jgi:hypothetical protein
MTIQHDMRACEDDMTKFVNRIMAQLALPDDTTINRRVISTEAEGRFVWAHLMLEILRWQTTNDGIREAIDCAGNHVSSMVTDLLRTYGTVLDVKEVEELDLIFLCVSHAARPLAVSELGNIIESTMDAHALAERIRKQYSGLLQLVRDDGLSTGPFDVPRTTLEGAFFCVPTLMFVEFAHPTIAD